MKIKMIAIAAAAAVATVFSANLNAQALPPAPKKNIQQEEVKLPTGYIHGLGCEVWSIGRHLCIAPGSFAIRVFHECPNLQEFKKNLLADATSRPSAALFNVKALPFKSGDFRKLPDMASVGGLGYRVVLTGYIRTAYAGSHAFLYKPNSFDAGGRNKCVLLTVKMDVNKKTIFDAATFVQDAGNENKGWGGSAGSTIELPEAGFYPFSCEIIVSGDVKNALANFTITVREPGKKTYRELKITDFATVE